MKNLELFIICFSRVINKYVVVKIFIGVNRVMDFDFLFYLFLVF